MPTLIAHRSSAGGLRHCLPFLLLIAACGKDAGPAGDVPPPAPASGVYSGVFPCDGCPGIDVALWLRADGTFLLEQRYRSGEAPAPPPSHALGNWEWRPREAVLELSSGGPARIFDRPADGVLVQQTVSPVEHRLDRDASRARLDTTLRLRGAIRQAGDGYRFRECRTGLDAPVATGGDYRRFRNQFRSVVSGAEAPVELIGHFDWGPDGAPAALVIDEFVTLRKTSTC